MSGQHTPAPWGYTWHKGEVEIFDGTADSPGCESLYIYVSNDSLICSQADARLIAAAPDLLEALRWFVDDERFQVAVGGNPIVVERMIADARVVYSKATGEA